jgi:beta-glucosidase
MLFGDYNPGGRLPITFYQSVAQLPPFSNYHMAGRTYRYLTEEPLFPFGHGLSYTRFEYANLQIAPLEIVVCSQARNAVECRPRHATTLRYVADYKQMDLRLEVKNVGERAGDEVVQLYVRHPASRVTRPLQELKGFSRITLQPGEAQTVPFTLPARSLAYYDERERQFVVEPGPVQVLVGSSSADIRLIGEFEVIGEEG